MSNTKDFCVAHYTGKVSYDTNDITEKNRDFLPPEMVETLRRSNNSVIRTLFTNQLSRSGNLTIMSDQNVPVTTGKKKRWGAALVAEKQEARVSFEKFTNFEFYVVMLVHFCEKEYFCSLITYES